MARPHTLFRTLLALILLGLMAIVCVRLGYWQLERAAQRIAIRQSIEAGRNSPPLLLDAQSPAQALTPWRPASAQGTWRHELTVLLENRNYKGRPGYWVATPLMLDDTDNTAVLVLRGWLPRPASIEQPLQAIPMPKAKQTVTGELLARVPRLFELSSATQLPPTLPTPDHTPPKVQNLDLATYASATGLKFIPTVLAQTTDAIPLLTLEHANTQLLREWPEPSLDADQNKGYALQWFGFATIAAIAWLVVAWRAWRRFSRPKTF